MQKIPTVFLRNQEDRRYVTDEVNPECRWVFAGDGEATRKYDGTCGKSNIHDRGTVLSKWAYRHTKKTGHGWRAHR